tara:strand:+ start:1915 stop:2709 length:795 start_codon:yes stop_codon:yes gene_type:complete
MKLEYIIEQVLKTMIQEAPAIETNNAPRDAVDSPFTPAEEKFLGKFDAHGSKHMGIIYSPSDIGIREFIARSGSDFNASPGIILSLIRSGVIKIVPYTGYGRNTDYTVELQLSLDDVKGLGANDKEAVEAGSSASGGAAPSAIPEEPMPGPEVSWVIKYGDILKESVTIAKSIITESTKNPKSKVYANKSRILNRLPKEYIRQLERIIDMLIKKTNTTHEKERVIADVLDNLQANFDLSAKHIRQSYEFHKNQKRLQKEIEKNK